MPCILAIYVAIEAYMLSIRTALMASLNAISGPPYYYLDFEHLTSAIPLFDGVRPFEPIITQFSLHRMDSDYCGGGDASSSSLQHFEYLSDGSVGSLRELCLRLLSQLEEHPRSSIIVYSSSEATQMVKLSERYPDLAARLLAARDRIFDLERTIGSCIAHPEFRGRTSLKLVLPALVPQYTGHYESLAISDGAEAVMAFERMLDPSTGAKERDFLRDALLEYCSLDTMGLVELHRSTHDLANGERDPS
eukprot:jgi/Bigna1/72527/fgenesh1_pg.20_\